MKNIINLVYVVLCTLVVSCSSFLDEKPQSDFMQEGTGTEDHGMVAFYVLAALDARFAICNRNIF